MSVMASRPVLRWTLPAAVAAAVIGGGVLSAQLRAAADVTLPQRSPAQLLADVASVNLAGGSGTLIEKSDLGLPALPGGSGGDGSSQLNSLVSGSHTLRVWFSGPDKARVALLGALGESDIILNDRDVWIWSSSNNTATHERLPAPVGSGGSSTDRPHAFPSASGLPLTPQQAATEALALLSGTTSVTTEPSTEVAGRPAYLLSVAPRDSTSLIAKIRIAIDGTAHVPTRVEVFAKGHPDAAAFSIGFSQIDLGRPDDDRFAFTPPPDTKVTEAPDLSSPSSPRHGTQTATIGSGWASVFVARLGTASLAPFGGGTAAGGNATPSAAPGLGGPRGTAPDLGAYLANLPRVSGSWGSGRLLSSRLFSVLLTDDGRVLVGAVGGGTLQKAAADPAARLG